MKTYTLAELEDLKAQWLAEIKANPEYHPPFPDTLLTPAIFPENLKEDEVEAIKQRVFLFFSHPLVYCGRCQAHHRILPSPTYEGCYSTPNPFVYCDRCGGHHMPPVGSCGK